MLPSSVQSTLMLLFLETLPFLLGKWAMPWWRLGHSFTGSRCFPYRRIFHGTGLLYLTSFQGKNKKVSSAIFCYISSRAIPPTCQTFIMCLNTVHWLFLCFFNFVKFKQFFKLLGRNLLCIYLSTYLSRQKKKVHK